MRRGRSSDGCMPEKRNWQNLLRKSDWDKTETQRRVSYPIAMCHEQALTLDLLYQIAIYYAHAYLAGYIVEYPDVMVAE